MEFKKQLVSYAEEKSNRSATSHYGVEPKRVREWVRSKKIKVKQARRHWIQEGGRKCNG